MARLINFKYFNYNERKEMYFLQEHSQAFAEVKLKYTIL